MTLSKFIVYAYDWPKVDGPKTNASPKINILKSCTTIVNE